MQVAVAPMQRIRGVQDILAGCLCVCSHDVCVMRVVVAAGDSISKEARNIKHLDTNIKQETLKQMLKLGCLKLDNDI